MWPGCWRWRGLSTGAAAVNLEIDETLLDEIENDPSIAILRAWESSDLAVVLGRSNVLDREVHVADCKADGVPILRRSSGGGAVVIGPGCLCFTLALPIPDEFPQLGISGVTRAVMTRLAEGLSCDGIRVAVRGISDLAIDDRKICGNAQRWRRRAFLHHGSLLYDFDLPRITRYLRHPSRRPEYRRDRSHQEFVRNDPRPRAQLVEALRRTWIDGSPEP